jgi:(p)ppGpp synthase/HD superfamily hydrolase
LPPKLEDAIALACTAHRGQVDKNGQPYILHVLRVMMKQNDPVARIIAALHDVVEDSATTIADLRDAGYSEEICSAVDALTRRETEAYDEMIARVAANSLARRVKLADLEDNMDQSRRRNGLDDAERQARYTRAYAALRG